MQFRVLGPVEAYGGDRRIELGASMPRAVLALLVISVNRVVPLDRLIDELWAGAPPATATTTLHGYLSGLRRALEPDRPPRAPFTLVVTQAPGYLLRAGADDIDALCFETMVVHARRELVAGRPGAARDTFRDALNLWRGPAYADFAYHAFAQAEISRLSELRRLAEEGQAEVELALGGHHSAVPELERLAGAEPLRERRWELLALALYRSGRQSEALRALDRARCLLADELGLDPGPGLRRLEDDVLAQSPKLDWRPPDPATPLVIRAPDAHPAGDEPSSLALIGRRDELARLQALLESARRGRPQTALVSGEPGIGKTRLVEELSHLATEGGAWLVVWGRCPETEGTPPYWPWAQALTALVQADDPTVLAAVRPVASELSQLVSQVKELVGEVQPPPALDAPTARYRLHQAVLSVLAWVAATRPLVVVVDDLQWADPASLELVKFVAAGASGAMAVIATYRHIDAAPDRLADLLGALARLSGVVRIRLGGLDRQEAGELAGQATGTRPPDSALAELQERTEGNPFFVLELARLLCAQGRWDQRPAGTEALVPEAVADVIRGRLARLPETTCWLLEVAAVAGRDFEVAVVAAAAGVDEDDAVDLIDVALAAGVVVDDSGSPGRYHFSHALVQEAVYARLSAMRRARLHAKVGRAMAERWGGDGLWAAQIARQFRLGAPASGVDPAIRWAIAAAEVAQGRLAWEQAEQHFRSALELVAAKVDERARFEEELHVQRRLAVLLSLTQGWHSPPVAEAWSRARELCGRLGDLQGSLAPLWGLARQARGRAQQDLARHIGEELLDLGRESSDPMFDVAGHETCGIVAFYAGAFPAAVDHLTAALAAADRPEVDTQPAASVMHPVPLCRSYLANAVWLLGDDVRWETLIAEALGFSRSSKQPMNQIVAFVLAAQLDTLRGDRDRAAERVAAILEVGETGGIGPLAAMAHMWAAWAGRGDVENRILHFEKALADLLATGWRLGHTYFLWLFADLQRQAGLIDEARSTVERALTEVETTGERYVEAPLCQLLGELVAAADPGRLDDAERWLRRAIAVSTEQQAPALTHLAVDSLDRVLAGRSDGSAGHSPPASTAYHSGRFPRRQ